MRHKPQAYFGRPRGSQPIDELLASANPVLPAALESTELAAALDRLGERIVARRQTPGVRHGRRLATAVTFAAVALVVAAVAAGAMVTTHTGVSPKIAGTEHDTTEVLPTAAPE